MSALRWPARLYVLVVIAAAPLALFAARAAADAPLPNAPVLFALLFAFAAVAQLRPVRLTLKIRVGVADTAIFAGALLFSPFHAMILCGGAILAAKVLARRSGVETPWQQHAFNAASALLAAGAASAVYRSLATGELSVAANPLAVTASALTLYGTGMLLVDTVVALQLSRDPISVWWPIHRRELPQCAALYLLGALAALSVATHPWAIVLFAVPVAIVYLSLREVARLREQTKAAIYELADLVDLRDPYTHGHSQRVAAYAERLALRMRLSATDVDLVREAARMHDVGKIGTPDHVLQKPGPLDDRELAEMRTHAEYGARLLARLPEFWEGASLVQAHHERWDGAGYPRGLQAAEIPMEVAIIAVADAYDAMATDRPFRRALSSDQIRAELKRERGRQWEAHVVDEFLAMMEEELRPSAAPAPQAVPTTA